MERKNIWILIQKYGKEDLRFLVPMRPVRTVFGLIPHTSSLDKEEMQICRIVEDKHKLSDNYKITLQAENKAFGRKHYYISDFELMLGEETIRTFVELKLNDIY